MSVQLISTVTFKGDGDSPGKKRDYKETQSDRYLRRRIKSSNRIKAEKYSKELFYLLFLDLQAGIYRFFGKTASLL